jgi:TRAP-type uncharacterized transport system substrate-binding protein
MLRRRRLRGRLLGGLALLAFAISAVLLARTYWVIPPAPASISAGNTEGLWHRYLRQFAAESGQWPARLRLAPVVTAGTLDNLERIDRGELDFALVQGGFDIERFTHVRQVASLPQDPLHLLVKPGLHEAVVKDFGALRGKRINLGSGKRSGTYWLSREILAFAGLEPSDYESVGMTSEQLRAEKRDDRMPDVVFIATKPPSELVKSLIDRFGYRLVPLPFGQAFRATSLQLLEPVPDEGIKVRKEHIPDAVIPAYSYDVSPPVPPQDIASLGCRALLITNERTDAAKVVHLLDDLLASRSAQTVQPPLTAEIVRQPAEAAWHPGAIEFRRRGEPLITGELIGVLSNTLQLLIPVGGGMLLLWGWLRARVLTDRERRIDRFIALVSGVEQRALQSGVEAPADLGAVRALHRELSTIKDAALERIAAGEAGNEMLVTSLFAHIGDVRAYLSDLERDSPNHRPSGDGRPPSAEARPA